MPKDHRSVRALAAAARLYKRKPDATTEEFRKVCERADKATIKKLTNRELNASYALPFRRSKALKVGSKKKVRRATTRRSRSRRKLSAQERISRLVRERDVAIMDAASDPRKAYEVASRVSEFTAELLKVATG